MHHHGQQLAEEYALCEQVSLQLHVEMLTQAQMASPVLKARNTMADVCLNQTDPSSWQASKTKAMRTAYLYDGLVYQHESYSLFSNGHFQALATKASVKQHRTCKLKEPRIQ